MISSKSYNNNGKPFAFFHFFFYHFFFFFSVLFQSSMFFFISFFHFSFFTFSLWKSWAILRVKTKQLEIFRGFAFFHFSSCFFIFFMFFFFFFFLRFFFSFIFLPFQKYFIARHQYQSFTCRCFLRCRCSMEMWCSGDKGRESWGWVGPPAEERA